ncbi:MAG: hypothetical protein KHX31_09735 [Akkermansia sp.]|uniref:hypothetical protein n=1 Tax=Akkermansia sp. TaxID=1872421 RepID=UPI0025B9B352|nr:hypothetical protein [Akkermansia sp.]MBS5508905.1 hypothetical protein [Akkermansia sp.]
MDNGHIDISLTLGTRADMRGIDQVRKGVDDLSTAAKGLPRDLISGGVGTVANARSFSGASFPGKMTIQVEGLDRLAGTIVKAEGVAASGLSSQGRTDKALDDMQAGIARVSQAVEEVARVAAFPDRPLPSPAPGSGNEWMVARLDQIAALLVKMEATLAKSLAASTKPEGTLDQMRKGVDELSRALKAAPLLSSGGVGGQTGAVPAYQDTPAPGQTGQDWNVRIEGLDALGATVQGADKTVGKAADAVGQQSGWLQRSIDALKNLPGQIQSWSGNQMRDWRKFNGGLQNTVNVLNLGKQAWGVGTAAGNALNDAFGLGVKKVNAQVAQMLEKAKAKVEAWQAGMSAELGRMNQENALKKENALVKQINDAYDARKRTIEALDEKASRNLEMQAQLLAIENEKNRSIIRQKQIRGEMTESQARDALAAIDAKDAGERRDIERQQAENAVKRAEALAEAKAEQIRRMQELSQSSPAAAAVKNLDTKKFYDQADSYKNAEATLKEWRELEARRAKLQKEVDGAAAEMAKAAMIPVAGAAIVKGLQQKKAQDEENLKNVKARMDSMRQDANMPEASNGEMVARLAAEKQQQEAALDKMMDAIKNTGLLGDVRGKSGDALYIAYAEGLKMAQSVIFQRIDTLEALFKEQEALDESVATAKDRLKNVLTVQGVQVKADQDVQTETKKTDTWQDNQRRDSTVSRTAAEGLSKAAEARKKELDANKKAMDTAAETLDASLDSFSNFAAKYAEGSEKAQERITKFLDTVNRLKNKDRKLWDKRDKDDFKWVDEFLKALKDKFGNTWNTESDQGMVKAATQAVQSMSDVLDRKKKQEGQEQKIKELEEAARKAATLTDDIQTKSSSAMELTEWMRKFRDEATAKAGDLAGSSDYEILYQVEDVVRKVLQDGQVDKGERGQLSEQLRMLLANDHGQDETPAIHSMVELVKEILGRYSTSQSAEKRLNAEVAELKRRLNRIDSQRTYGN